MSISLNGDGIISGVSTLTNPSEITVGTGASIFSPTTNTLALGTNGSERVRIDSSGNFGLGTNSPATLFEAKSTTTNLARIRVSGTSATAGNFRGYEFSNGSVFKGGFLQDESTDLISIFTPVGGQSVNITSAGLVGIGTTGPAKALEVRTASGIGQIRVGRSTGSTFNYDIGRDNDATGFLYFYGNQTGATGFVFSGVDGERARITSSGQLLVGTTSAGGAGTFGKVRIIGNNENNLYLGSTTTGGWRVVSDSLVDGGLYYHINFLENGTQRGSITSNGSSTSYTTTSDYRLKENVVQLTGATDRLNQLQVHRFNFITDPNKTVDGFIAHEAQAVVPECVTGVKDAVDSDGNPIYQGIDQSKLVPLLTAALQEALAEIESLKARVTALEP